MNKKAIAILGAIFLLIVGTLGFLIYAKYSKKPTIDPPVTQVNPQPVNNNSTSTPPVDPTPAPQSKVSGIVKLTDDQVVSPVLFFSGSGINYFDRQGNLYQASLQDNNGQLQMTNKKKLEVAPKAGITKILWPSKGGDFIAQILDATGKTGWSYFNSSVGQYVDLPPQITAVDWMPAGNKIMYIWLENNKATLNIANPDSTNWHQSAEMWETDDSITVSPDGSQVLYYEIANTGSNNAINSVSSDGKSWKGLVKSGQNYGALWSPDGQKFLFAKRDVNTQKYQLWIYNLTSGEVKNLGLFTTVSKVVWDKDSNIIYAAVPTSGSAGEASLTVDGFFRMDTSSLDKKQYSANNSMQIDGRDLFLNNTSDKLFFRNAQDGALYYLDLTQQ